MTFGEALVQAWNHHRKLGAALVIMYEIDGEQRISGDQWQAMKEGAGISPNTDLSQPVRAWIANHFNNANNALWDGKQALAVKWINSGKDRPPPRRERPATEAKREIRRNAHGRLFLNVRERDTRTGWKTVK